ncbi:MAG: carboxypeptidase-like regulatory domain-containing protein [Ignavibacteria bacterium]|nr:carboxypeptidase-like regulatory domain-containing protein [Ignavibacteria bacterium]
MKKVLTIFIVFLLTGIGIAQNNTLSGVVRDDNSGEVLSFATVKLTDSSYGTSTDKNGFYILHLRNGKYNIAFSHIGYNTKVMEIVIDNPDIVLNVLLTPSSIFTEEIEVYGEDPAYGIIRKAIEYKKAFKKDLKEYDYDAYSKFVIRSNIAKKDSLTGKGRLGILGLLESETKGYFRAPDEEKLIVKAKRESENIIKGFAIPLIVNFYDEEIVIGDLKIPGPVSDDAFDYYEYKLRGTTSIDSIAIYKIEVINISEIKPRFRGFVYILDSLWALKKTDLTTNESAMTGGFENLNFVQKFHSYKDRSGKEFYLPTDIQIYAEGSALGLIKIQGEALTIVSNYFLNEKAPPGIFDEFVVKVMPDSKKDSTYWVNNQLIKNSDEELNSYRKIEEESKKRKKSISFGISTINYGEKFKTDILDLYKFNKTEGNNLGLNLIYGNSFDRIYAYGKYNYGFSDKKLKYELSGRIRLFYDNSLTLRADVFRKLNTLFFIQTDLNLFANTLSSLFYKEDFYDYYYSNGFALSVSKRIIPQLNLSIEYIQEKSNSAVVNTDFSFFNKAKSFDANPPVNEYFRSAVSTKLTVDPNDFRAIDWGDGEISRFKITGFPVLNFGFDYSGKRINSGYEFRTFSADLTGSNKISHFANISYKAGTIIKTGEVPYQNLAYFNVAGFSNSLYLNFYGMNNGEFLGNKLYYVNLENNFGRWLWKDISIIKNLDLIGFLNAGKSEISESNYNIAAYKNFSETDKWYFETGFGLGNILSVFRLNFAWRLNNFKDGNNFKILLFVNNLAF